MFKLFKENTKIALGAIRSQLLRTVLTVFIIASGIWALVGILSAVNALENSLMSNFAAMGSNTFSISQYDYSSQVNRNSSETKINPAINYNQAKAFKEITNITGIVLTKLDGTAKGGIVLAIKEEVNLPVKFIGLGEGLDDLRIFDLEKFVNGLLCSFNDLV